MKFTAASLSLSWAATTVFALTHAHAAEHRAPNACTNGQMDWLLHAGYNSGNPCGQRDGIVKLHRVARMLVGSDSYELYDFSYSFLAFPAALVRHGGERLLVLKNGKYVGLYLDAAGGKWLVHGSRATVTWSETGAVTTIDLSAGLPDSIQVGDGGFVFLDKR